MTADSAYALGRSDALRGLTPLAGRLWPAYRPAYWAGYRAGLFALALGK